MVYVKLDSNEIPWLANIAYNVQWMRSVGEVFLDRRVVEV